MLQGHIKDGNEMKRILSPNVIINDLPLGHIRWIPNILMKDPSELALDGQAVSNTLYAKLLSWANAKAGLVIAETEWQEKYTASNGLFVPYFSIVDDNTFRVPCLKAYAKGGDRDSAGEFIEAGLPNIEGRLAGGYTATFGENGTYGAFSTDGRYDYCQAPLNEARNDLYANFDASRSNAIYGNSDTVTPNTMQGIYVIKAFGRVTNNSELDVATIAEEVDNNTQELVSQSISIAGLTERTDVVASGDGYIRYANGLQICWGWLIVEEVNSNPRGWAWGFPVAFITTPEYSVCGKSGWGYDLNVGVEHEDATAIGGFVVHRSGTVNIVIKCIAIGRWK